MKNITWILLVFSCNLSMAQIDVDSVLNELRNPNCYTVTDTLDYLMERFIRYQKNDKSNTFDIYTDTNGLLSEYIGLALVQKNYDEKGRKTAIIGYHKTGDYFYWDFSPITEYTYSGDTIFTRFRNKKYELKELSAEVFDSSKRLIAKLNYDVNNQLIKKVIREYDDSEFSITTSYLSGKNEIITNSKGVSFIERKYENNDYSRVIEIYYYDSNREPIDADHEDLLDNEKSDLKYCKAISKMEDSDWITRYYSKSGELICFGDDWSLYIISKDD